MPARELTFTQAAAFTAATVGALLASQERGAAQELADLKRAQPVLEQQQAPQWTQNERINILRYAAHVTEIARGAGFGDFNSELIDDMVDFMLPTRHAKLANYEKNRTLVRGFLTKGGLTTPGGLLEWSRATPVPEKQAFWDMLTADGNKNAEGLTLIRVSGLNAMNVYTTWVRSLAQEKGIDLQTRVNLRLLNIGTSMSERPGPLGKRSELEALPKVN